VLAARRGDWPRVCELARARPVVEERLCYLVARAAVATGARGLAREMWTRALPDLGIGTSKNAKAQAVNWEALRPHVALLRDPAVTWMWRAPVSAASVAERPGWRVARVAVSLGGRRVGVVIEDEGVAGVETQTWVGSVDEEGRVRWAQESVGGVIAELRSVGDARWSVWRSADAWWLSSGRARWRVEVAAEATVEVEVVEETPLLVRDARGLCSVSFSGEVARLAPANPERLDREVETEKRNVDVPVWPSRAGYARVVRRGPGPGPESGPEYLAFAWNERGVWTARVPLRIDQ
jgi:hypothetical protein